MVLTDHFQSPYSYKLFLQVCTFLEPLDDGAVNAVTVTNCCIYWVCFFHNCVKYKLLWTCHTVVHTRNSLAQTVAHIYGTALVIRLTVHIWLCHFFTDSADYVYTLVAGLLARNPVVRKVLRPAISAQVFLVSLCLSISECWDGSLDCKLLPHAPHAALPA